MPEVSELTVRAALTFRLVDGKPADADWLLDAFAATVGNQNGARSNALRVTVPSDEPLDDATPTVYECWLVDDA